MRPGQKMAMGYRRAATALLVLALLAACQNNRPAPLFEELPQSKTGVSFSNDLTENEAFNLIEYLYFYNGGGVALGDINNDGLVDIYFSANQKENALYLNRGNWQFENIAQQAGVASPGGWKTGVTMADVNGDGLLDIYQCRLGDYKGVQGRNQLFLNNGDLTFSEQAAAYGLDFEGFSTHSAFLDYDLDGDLDLYLLNHSVHTERSYGRAALRTYEDPKAGDRLYRNDKGHFTPLTREAGIYSSHIGYGLGVGVADVNNDGWPDLYVSNDFSENDYLYLNNGAKTGGGPAFREVVQQSIGHTSRFSMGNDLADYNNDGWVDILSLDMLPQDEVVIKRSAGDDPYEIYDLKLKFGYGRQFTRNALQLNTGVREDGTPVFSEIAQVAGVHATDWSWSALFADYDLDGWRDLFISNGIRRRPNDMDYINFISNEEAPGGLKNNPNLSDKRLVDEMPDGAVPNYFFKNKGDLTFRDVSREWGMDSPTLSNGAAYADLDNDGDLDLVVNHINQAASLYRNGQVERAAPGSSAYLQIVPKGEGPNPFGVGLKAIAYAGDKRWTAENYPSRGFQSSVPPVVHLGLASIQKLDSLRLIWPGGNTQLLRDVPCNQALTVSLADAGQKYTYQQAAPPGLLQALPGLFPAEVQHLENDFNDFNSAFLLPHKLSREGPPIAVADVNGDGLEDIYMGHAAGGSGSLLLQGKNGLARSPQPVFAPADAREETDCLFFDANGDGFPDLYLVTGGNEENRDPVLLYDRLLLNDGQGRFREQEGRLPAVAQHGSVAVAADLDQDGDQDLFIGGRSVPARYGQAPTSYLLRNDGKGNFSDATAALAPDLGSVGMVSDAHWADLDGDTWPELVLVGEWMPITVFRNEKGKLTRSTPEGLAQSNGWWRCLALADLDGDGDLDIIAGNQGENTRRVPSPKRPLHLYADDYDGNGSLDPILAYTNAQGVFPVATKDELIKQVPMFKKKYVRHQEYAGKTVGEILGKEALQKSLHLEAFRFASAWIENKGKLSFAFHTLPLPAQFAPVYAILATDLNRDGHPDLLLGGNEYSCAPYFGSYDAGMGLALLGDGKGRFRALSPGESGLYVPGETRRIAAMTFQGKPVYVFARNDERPLGYGVR